MALACFSLLLFAISPRKLKISFERIRVAVFLHCHFFVSRSDGMLKYCEIVCCWLMRLGQIIFQKNHPSPSFTFTWEKHEMMSYLVFWDFCMNTFLLLLEHWVLLSNLIFFFFWVLLFRNDFIKLKAEFDSIDGLFLQTSYLKMNVTFNVRILKTLVKYTLGIWLIFRIIFFSEVNNMKWFLNIS